LPKRILFCIFILNIFMLGACKWHPKLSFSGYTDTLYLYLSSPSQGYLKEKFILKGQAFKKGQILYELDAMPDIVQLETAFAQYQQAQKTLIDLQRPRRKPEIAAIEFQIQQIDANIEKTNMHYQRLLKLKDKQYIDPDTLFTNQKLVEELQFQKKQLQENLRLSHMGARRYQIKAQQRAQKAARYHWKEVAWYLEHKKVSAPKDGYVFDIFYSIGELIPANKPVMSVVLPENNFIEFFVPAKNLKYLQLNQRIDYQYYGDNTWYSADINYISQTAEYMPPVLYTQHHQDDLVFRIRAKPMDTKQFILGQPINVRV
jgi:HlyD family secretion protein